nr:hypothetical protein Iba_scaffold10838CG0020 [Ipomoea batatas]
MSRLVYSQPVPAGIKAEVFSTLNGIFSILSEPMAGRGLFDLWGPFVPHAFGMSRFSQLSQDLSAAFKPKPGDGLVDLQTILH